MHLFRIYHCEWKSFRKCWSMRYLQVTTAILPLNFLFSRSGKLNYDITKFFFFSIRYYQLVASIACWILCRIQRWCKKMYNLCWAADIKLLSIRGDHFVSTNFLFTISLRFHAFTSTFTSNFYLFFPSSHLTRSVMASTSLTISTVCGFIFHFFFLSPRALSFLKNLI